MEPNHKMAVEDDQVSSLTRWYIDTRTLTSTTSILPLLETLQPCDQETVKRYYHLADRHMSLASYLLKYLFIHRTCQIPWSEVTISRSPAPHHRPCYIPSKGTAIPGIEFNVSHQASVVALAGTVLPTSKSPERGLLQAPTPSATPTTTDIPQLGIDITCVNERAHRRGQDTNPKTAQALAEFVDIFAEVFSPRELGTMKSLPGDTPSHAETEAAAVRAQLRVFYTYWALKEAFIKMTGEALLASWLRELEFTNVVPPPAVSECEWGSPYTGVRTWLRGVEVEDVRVEVVAFGENYLVATAARGGRVGAGGAMANASANGRDPWGQLSEVDIERDIKSCAMGSCGCIR